MRQIDGQRIGTWSLRADAAYCAVLGACVAFGAERIVEWIDLPPSVIAMTGVAVIAWALSLLVMLVRLPLRRTLHLVMVANVVAALAVGAVAIQATTLLVTVAVLAVSIDVAIFAASQLVAIRGLPASH